MSEAKNLEKPEESVQEEIAVQRDESAPEEKRESFFKRMRRKKANWRTSQKTVISVILTQIYLLILAVGTVVTVQLLQPIGPETLQRLLGRPNAFMVSLLIIWMISECIYLVSLKPWLSTLVVYTTVSVLALISGLKLQFRDEPLVFSDFSIIKETLSVAGDYGMRLRPIYIAAVFALLFMLFIASFIKKLKPKIKTRLLVAILSLAVFFLSAVFVFWSDNSVLLQNYIVSVWNPRLEYENNGVIMGFVRNTRLSLILPPDNYSERSVKEAAERLGYAVKPVGTALTDDQKPNIIVIMNECFWDPNFMTAARFNIDPLQKIKNAAAQPNAGFGYTLSPQFGGGTANVEYEFLTGMSMKYHQATNMIYQNNITEKTWSLAWYFKDLGYDTQAIHPYFDWYWHRNRNYPLMGFDRMYFKDTMNNARIKGVFISDQSTGAEIIERTPKDSEKPIFTFAVTMQNHGPHKGGQYSSHVTEISGLEKSPGVEKRAHDFAEGIHDGDELFAALTEYYKDSERPTYIMMFGDHAPPVASQEKLFKGGKISEEDRFNMQRCPLILWTNADREIADIPTTSNFMLGPELLKAVGYPLTGYQTVLEGLMTKTRGFTHQYLLDAQGQPAGESEESKSMMRDLELLQYDASFGKQYIVDLFAKGTE